MGKSTGSVGRAFDGRCWRPPLNLLGLYPVFRAAGLVRCVRDNLCPKCVLNGLFGKKL